MRALVVGLRFPPGMGWAGLNDNNRQNTSRRRL